MYCTINKREYGMGWFGYGLEDGDSTTSVAATFLEKAKVVSKDGEINLKKGIEDVFFLSIPEMVLKDEDLAKLYLNFDKAWAGILPKPVANGSLKLKDVPNHRKYKNFHEGNILIPIQMTALLFIANKARMPRNLLSMAKEANLMLIDSEHTDGFDVPSKRRKVLRNLQKQLNEADIKATRYWSNARKKIIHKKVAKTPVSETVPAKTTVKARRP